MKELLQTLTKRKYREIVCKTTDGLKFSLRFVIYNECRISLEFDANADPETILNSIDSVLRAFKEHKLVFTTLRKLSREEDEDDDD